MSDLLRDLHRELGALLDARDAATKPSSEPESGSMLGKWDPWYKTGQRNPNVSYGPPDTYKMAAAWLKGLSIEDWGCGYAQFKEFHEGGRYIGVDGTAGWADRVADLRHYQPISKPEGILLRHVLEHNPEWRAILANAVSSFTKRMVLVVFTPDSGTPGKDKPLAHVDAVNVDDLALPHAEIESFFSGCKVLDKKHVPTETGYSGETVWLIER